MVELQLKKQAIDQKANSNPDGNIVNGDGNVVTDRNSLIEKLHENAYKIDEKSDQLCSWLQIFTSCSYFKRKRCRSICRSCSTITKRRYMC